MLNPFMDMMFFRRPEGEEEEKALTKRAALCRACYRCDVGMTLFDPAVGSPFLLPNASSAL
jgi:hypothetical protein